MSPCQQIGGSEFHPQHEQFHQSFEISDPYPWSDIPPSNPSTPLDPGLSLYTTNGSSPDTIFADPALLELNHVIDNCLENSFPSAVGTSYPGPTLAAVDQYANALAYGSVVPPPMPSYDTAAIAGFPSSPRSCSGHSTASSIGGASPPNGTCSKESPKRVAKRQMNTLAARRYRKRRLDCMNELEAELEAVKREREEWRVKASKLEGEASALKRLLESRKEKKEK